jgi:hypothetical protein
LSVILYYEHKIANVHGIPLHMGLQKRYWRCQGESEKLNRKDFPLRLQRARERVQEVKSNCQ